MGKISRSHLICRTKNTFIPLTKGNSKGLRSSLLGTADENQVCILQINHTVTDADTDNVRQAHLAFIFLTPCQPPHQGIAFGVAPGDRLSLRSPPLPASLQHEVSQTCETIFSGSSVASILQVQGPGVSSRQLLPPQLPRLGPGSRTIAPDTPARGGTCSSATPESLLLLAGKSSCLGIGL